MNFIKNNITSVFRLLINYFNLLVNISSLSLFFLIIWWENYNSFREIIWSCSLTWNACILSLHKIIIDLKIIIFIAEEFEFIQINIRRTSINTEIWQYSCIKYKIIRIIDRRIKTQNACQDLKQQYRNQAHISFHNHND